MTHRAKRKAIWGTAAFAFFGILFAFTVKNLLYSLPTLILYAGLVINTYFSIRCFSSITPENDNMQRIVDIGLVASFLALASAFNNVQNFLTIGLLLFELAVIKYTLLLGTARTEYHALIRKKILVDMLGVVSGSLALATVLLGYTLFSIWFPALLLTAANVYLIILKPFYKVNQTT